MPIYTIDGFTVIEHEPTYLDRLGNPVAPPPQRAEELPSIPFLVEEKADKE